MNYIYNYTKEQLDSSAQIENKTADMEEQEIYSFYYYDKNGNEQYLFKKDKDEIQQEFQSLKLDEPISLKITNVSYSENHKELPSYSREGRPIFLNLTNVFQICSDLGASTEEINRILEYLYIEKYISYPRSKSEKWEIPIEADRINYAHNVLDALNTCGYPIKEYYYDSYGNEGEQSYSHPCIHPLPSITLKKFQGLKKINPLGFLVFNEIVIHTLKCFEKLPFVKEQNIDYELYQNSNFFHSFSDYVNVQLLEENLLTFNGYYYSGFDKELNVEINDVFPIDLRKSIKINYELEKNRQEIEMLNDFDVINFLNENDIGTDATRSVILNSLIKLQYFVSNKMLLSTFLGNTLSNLANKYVKFIDISYTLYIEERLNEIEKGLLSTSKFQEDIKNIIENTNDLIKKHIKEIEDIFLDIPKCEIHNTPMVIKQGRYGKFLQCPFFYINDENCNQKFSI